MIEPKLCECTLLRYPDHGVLGEEFGARRTGFIGAFGVLGAALSGYLLAKVIDVWGWNGFFLALSIPLVVRALLLPLLGQRKQLAQRVAGPDEA
ncbi:hypothetical protein ACUXVY_04025 [Chromobacterium haemolyticum]|uniref:hypothetical protein n=1 Tax=Chromobacterium haemolyticum TaxID=394935 RepID=UPI004056DD12